MDLYSAAPVGLLVYTREHMSVQIMRPDRPFLGDRLGGSTEAAAAAARGYQAYFGTYSYQAESGVVEHHIDGALTPDWVGTTQLRYAQLSRDGLELTLTTAPLTVKGEEVVGTLVWRRISEPEE